MTVRHACPERDGGIANGQEIRINPRTHLTVERKLPSGRWQVISKHATPADARARFFALTGRPQNGR